MKIDQITENEPYIRIAVVAVGSDGCTVLSRVVDGVIEPVITVALNTDSAELTRGVASNKVLVGHSIDESLQVTHDLLSEVDLVFLLVDNTQILLASQVAHQVAKNDGKCIALLLPSLCADGVKSGARPTLAANNLAQLRLHAIAVLELPEESGSPPFVTEGKHGTVSDMTTEIATNFCRAIISSLREGLIGVDFDDVVDVLQGGHIKFGFGEKSECDTAVMDAFLMACCSPMLNLADLTTASKALVAVESPEKLLKLTSLRDLSKKVASLIKIDATSILSATKISPKSDVVRVYIITSN